jgi:hypothetical protein
MAMDWLAPMTVPAKNDVESTCSNQFGRYIFETVLRAVPLVSRRTAVNVAPEKPVRLPGRILPAHSEATSVRFNLSLHLAVHRACPFST